MGGAERLVVELAARLPERGYRTKIIALFDGGALWKEVRDRNIRWVQTVPSVDASRIELLRQLKKTIFAEPGRRPAIVHTHLFGADFWSILARELHEGSRILYERRVPPPVFISTAHNIDHEDTSLRRFARRWAVRRMDKVIAISKDVKQYARHDLRVKENHIQVVTNGVDFDRIPSRGKRAFDGTPRFIVVGRLEPQKGHETLLRALKDVSPPWRLDIVGSGSLERELRELTEQMHIASRVHFLGERYDVGELLAASDMFLFPSHWEGMGLALLEAMAAGLPFLASDLPAIREFVSRPHLVAPEDPFAWTEAITKSLASSKDLIKKAGDTETRIRKKYGIDRMVDEYAKIYKGLIG
jgi:glycosyltransferase involved in cell wall biosynthesis